MKTKKSKYKSRHFFLTAIFIFVSNIVNISFAGQAHYLSVEQYRERLSKGMAILESAEADEGFPSPMYLNQLKDIFPPKQIVTVGSRDIHVNNQPIFSLLSDIGREKDKARVRQKIKILKNKISLLFQETKEPQKQFPDDSKFVIKKILAGKEFSQKRLPPFLEKVSKWIEEKIRQLAEGIKNFFSHISDKVSSLFERLIKFLHSLPIPKSIKSTYDFFTVFIYIAAGALVILFMVLFVKYKWYAYFFRFSKRQKATLSEVSQSADLQNWQVLRQQADEAYRSGDFKSAFHYLYLSLLLFFEEKKMLIYHESTTNWEYLNQLKGYPVLCKSFKQVTILFEQVWYGGKKFDGADYNEFAGTYRNLITDRVL